MRWGRRDYVRGECDSISLIRSKEPNRGSWKREAKGKKKKKKKKSKRKKKMIHRLFRSRCSLAD